MSTIEPQRIQEGDAAPENAPTQAAGGHGATVARNAFHLLLGQVASTVLGLALTSALARYLGDKGYGDYFFLTTVATFAYVVVEWGQPMSIPRGVATHPERCGELLGSALGLRVAAVLPIALIGGLVTWALPGNDLHLGGLTVALIGALLAFSLSQAYGSAFRGRDRMSNDALVTGVNKALLLVLTVPALALGGRLGAVIAVQAAAGVAALALAAVLYRRLGAPRLHFSATAARELVASGAPMLAMAAAASVQPVLDSAILKMLAPAALGWYGAARNISLTLYTPASILGQAFYPRLSRAARNPADLRATASTALRAMLWLGALGATGTYLFSGIAVGLIYGNRDYGPATLILQVVAPGLFLLFVDMLLGPIVFATGGSRGFAIAKMVSVGVSTALDFMLIPWFEARWGNGGVGVVVAFAISEFAVFVGALIVLPRGTLPARSLLDVGRALAAAGATVLVFKWLLPPLSPAVGLLVAVPACVVFFAAASLALRLVSRQDLTLFKALIRPRGGEVAEEA
jgi:O-antigen/teichoic acid export membrane protein